jgi:antitoxin component YwqK of YwqJK toxin-antitoxin module
MQPVFEATYHNDKLEGKYTKYDINGNTIMSGNYKNGLPVGEWTIYDADTKKFKKVKYVDGKPENYEQLEEAEAKKLEQMMQQAKEVVDPQDYINNPEDYPINNR